eukprot:1152579-Pelagomonas_calceolata.AAC.11
MQSLACALGERHTAATAAHAARGAATAGRLQLRMQQECRVSSVVQPWQAAPMTCNGGRAGGGTFYLAYWSRFKQLRMCHMIGPKLCGWGLNSSMGWARPRRHILWNCCLTECCQSI